MKKNNVLLYILIAFVVAGCDPGNQAGHDLETVKIGVIAPFSGPGKVWGENALMGVETALAAEGIISKGIKPVLVLEDDKNQPELTRQKLQKLVEVDNVSAVLLFSDSNAVLAAIELIEHCQTPILIFYPAHPDVAKTKWVSQVSFDDKIQATVAALYVIDELLIDHAAVVKDSHNQKSVALADAFAAKFIKSGGGIELVDIGEGHTDFSSVAASLRLSGVEFLYLPLGARQVTEIEREMRQIDWNPQAMVSAGLLSSLMLENEDDPEIVDGLLATEVYTADLPETDFGKKVKPVFKKFRTQYDQPGTTYAGLGCEGMSILLEAMARCDDRSDRQCINRMLRSTDSFGGLAGRVRIMKNGTVERPVFINTIHNKRLEFVVKIY